MHMSIFGILIIVVFATTPPLIDYVIVSRFGELNLRGFFGDREFRQILGTMVMADVLAAAGAWFVAPLAWPGSDWAWLSIGIVVMCIGNGLRYWAILTLGRFFRFVVEIQDGHRVVTDGPYRLIRHPAYTGLLLTQLGLGIAIGNSLSVVLCVTIPMFGLIPRIQHEELALNEDLGAEYEEYASATKRLIPRIW